jgi:predicted Zn-dependent protease
MHKTTLAALALILAAHTLSVRAQFDDLEKALKKVLPPAGQPRKEEVKPKPAQPKATEKPQQAQPKQQAKPEQSFSIPPFGPVPLASEVKIGRQIAGNLLGAAPLVQDAKLQQYVNSVGRWVALQSGRPDLNWTFGVIESGDINAFAAPGGYIFVTRGLYVRLKDEAELAGVLAHEIAHVQQQHHLKVLQQQQLIGLGSELLGQQVGGDAAVQRLIGSGAEIMARGLDKSAEFEADRIGVVLATRAGYDPWGLPLVLQDIGAVSKSDSGVALLFKTHPHPDERLTALSEAMGERFDEVSGKAVKDRMYRLPAK